MFGLFKKTGLKKQTKTATKPKTETKAKKDNGMAKSNYDKCLKIILHHEGGYVNHPKDLVEKLTSVLLREYTKNGVVKRYERFKSC